MTRNTKEQSEEMKPLVSLDELSESMDINRDRIKDEVIDTIIDKVKVQASWEAEDSIRSIVSDVMKNELRDEIRSIILEQRDVILGAIREASLVVARDLAENIIKSSTKNLANSYNMTQILNVILKQ